MENDGIKTLNLYLWKAIKIIIEIKLARIIDLEAVANIANKINNGINGKKNFSLLNKLITNPINSE